MVEYLLHIPSVVPIILDNNSTYKPLLDWYSHCPAKVVKLGRNRGHLCAWTCGLLPLGKDHRKAFGQPYYAVSDPDLDLTGCPPDLFDVLRQGLESHPEAIKAGVSLEITDIPAHNPLKFSIETHESNFWKVRADDRFWWAGVDTVLALYHCDRVFDPFNWISPALRSDRPYTAKHMPWYSDPSNLSEEERKYLANTNIGHWSSLMRMTLPRPVGPTIKFL